MGGVGCNLREGEKLVLEVIGEQNLLCLDNLRRTHWESNPDLLRLAIRKDMEKIMEEDIHESHCNSCFSSTCSLPACQTTACPNHCGFRLHSCKLADHLSEVCPLQQVSCINSCYGCPHLLLRQYRASHLEHCPASLVVCCQSWNRCGGALGWPLSLRGQPLQHYQPGQLDFELLLRDQRSEKQLAKVPRRVKVSLRSVLTMRYPATPLPESCLSVPREAGDRGVADKQYMVDNNGNIVDVVMQNYLRAQAKLETAWKQDLESRLGTTLVTEATMLQREGIHNHCRSCIVSSCTLGKLFDPALWRESCPIGDCPWACGVRFHMCKANDHAFLCPNYRPPDALDWLRRLGGPGYAAQEEEEEDTDQEQRKYSVTAEARGKSPPSQPYHLQEPTYLNVAQECLHPLQPAPSKIRSFVCAKVFRRDEIASHLATVHQTIVPGLNSSWLQIR